MNKTTSARIAILAAALFATAAERVSAQCPGDDGLRIPGACCVPAAPKLPQFPPFAYDAAGACWRDCTLELRYPAGIVLGQPFQLVCDTYLVPLSIFGPATAIVPTFLVAKYQRTWNEVSATGNFKRQVWRFLVNTDIQYLPNADTGPCPVPPCAGALAGFKLPVHFIGSLDYAMDCAASPNWSAAINLTHLPGAFMHGPFSARPVPAALAHPDRAYSFVGPEPFAFGLAALPSGAIVADAARSTEVNFTVSPFVWKCKSEVPVLQGSLATVFDDCLGSAVGAPQWGHQKLGFTYGCTAASAVPFATIPIGTLLPTGLAAMRLGAYAMPPGVYPGSEDVSVYIGVAATPDPCAGAVFFPPIHIVTGVGTVGGDLALLFPSSGPTIATRSFLDLENMLLVSSTPVLSPGIGALFASSHVWGLNN